MDAVEWGFKELYEMTVSLITKTPSVFTKLIEILAGLGDTATGDKEVTEAFIGIGTSLCTFFMVLEMFSTMVGFRFERMEDAVRLGCKYVLCKVVIENTATIIDLVYVTFFKGFGIDKIPPHLNNIFDYGVTITASKDIKPGVMGINYAIPALINIIVWVIIVFMLIKLLSQISGVIFEICMHKAVAPVALSTLCFDQARSAGISFTKSYCAVCLQGLVITACFIVYETIMNAFQDQNAWAGLYIDEFKDSKLFLPVVNYLVPIFGLMILSTAISRASDLTKRMLGA